MSVLTRFRCGTEIQKIIKPVQKWQLPRRPVNDLLQEFRVQNKVNSTYVIEFRSISFTLIPSVRTALRVVKAKQGAPLEERMAFLMSPSRAITEAYRGEGDENKREVPIGDTIFFETSEYSDRIVGIGEWIPPQLSYLETRSEQLATRTLFRCSFWEVSYWKAR